MTPGVEGRADGPASMQPRSEERGEPFVTMLPVCRWHASMQPRSEERGEATGCHST